MIDTNTNNLKEVGTYNYLYIGTYVMLLLSRFTAVTNLNNITFVMSLTILIFCLSHGVVQPCMKYEYPLPTYLPT